MRPYELILFSIEKNNFAIDLGKIKRIIQAQVTTPVAGSHNQIEGVVQFENRVINVLNFRKMIHLPPFGNSLKKLFPELIADNKEWVAALKESVEQNTPFVKEQSPYDCSLGKWMSGFQSYDPTVSEILDTLFNVHAKLHSEGIKVLRKAKMDRVQALKDFDHIIKPMEGHIQHLLEKLLAHLPLIVNSMQKFLIMDANPVFAVRIDDIDDIITIDANTIQTSDDVDDQSQIRFGGIFEYKKKLVNLIDAIASPRRN